MDLGSQARHTTLIAKEQSRSRLYALTGSRQCISHTRSPTSPPPGRPQTDIAGPRNKVLRMCRLRERRATLETGAGGGGGRWANFGASLRAPFPLRVPRTSVSMEGWAGVNGRRAFHCAPCSSRVDGLCGAEDSERCALAYGREMAVVASTAPQPCRSRPGNRAHHAASQSERETAASGRGKLARLWLRDDVAAACPVNLSDHSPGASLVATASPDPPPRGQHRVVAMPSRPHPPSMPSVLDTAVVACNPLFGVD